MKPPRIPEKTEQAHGVQLLRSIGADVWTLGTVRAKGDYPGTRQTPGLPDVFAVLPVLWSIIPSIQPPPRRALWWECKAVGGRLRPEQRHFQRCCVEADLWHVVGTFDDLLAALADWGYLRREGLAHYRSRP